MKKFRTKKVPALIELPRAKFGLTSVIPANPPLAVKSVLGNGLKSINGSSPKN